MEAKEQSDTRRAWVNALGPLRSPLVKLRDLFPHSGVLPPESNGFLESLSVDEIFFPFQGGFIRSALPSIYSPYDLQHLHHPDFFSRRAFSRRELTYRAGCNEASIVTSPSEYVASDIKHRYGISAHKIRVVLLAAPNEFYPAVDPSDIAKLERKYDLPGAFALYPAQTWPHKNHLALLEAIQVLKSKNVRVNVVCTGLLNEHFSKIRRRARSLDVEHQITFLGFVTEKELATLYERCSFLIFPSLFEGAGMPILEAFRARRAVACSKVASLPEYGGEAAVYFDPCSTGEIADAIEQLWSDESIRDSYARHGHEWGNSFSWHRTFRNLEEIFLGVAEASQGLT